MDKFSINKLLIYSSSNNKQIGRICKLNSRQI